MTGSKTAIQISTIQGKLLAHELGLLGTRDQGGAGDRVDPPTTLFDGVPPGADATCPILRTLNSQIH